MSQVLDNGRTIAFGQDLDEVEQTFGIKAEDDPSPVARKGVDKLLRTALLGLEFDSGKLDTITFEQGYEFRNPPSPYPEPWKNFVAIGPMRISGGMARKDFLSYLTAWEQRAQNLGAEKMELGDLTSVQFAVSIDQDEFVDMIHVSMGSSRRAGGGGIWCDGWTLFFTMESDRRDVGETIGFSKPFQHCGSETRSPLKTIVFRFCSTAAAHSRAWPVKVVTENDQIDGPQKIGAVDAWSGLA
jgi:hypothetical protein